MNGLSARPPPPRRARHQRTQPALHAAVNERRFYPLVDDKLATKRMCQEAGLPVPRLLAVAEVHAQAKRLLPRLAGESAFVLKPARGAMGNGILVLDVREGKMWRGNRIVSAEDFVYHAAGIISGLYSLAGHADVAMVEEKLIIDERIAPLAVDGVPDLRVIVYRGIPVMAMMRLPTSASGGTIRISARVASLPQFVQDYVIVHELLHFSIPNHGKLWKSLMRSHLGEYEAHEGELKRIAGNKALQRTR